MEELKNLLTKIGYNEKQIESISNKQKIYFQDDVDNIVNKSKETLTDKYNKNFVSKTEYDLLQSEHNNLIKENKLKAIKDEFVKNGGNENYFKDYMDINKHLMELNDETLAKQVAESTNKQVWAFNQKQNVPYGYQDKSNNSNTGDEFDGETIYGKKWDNI